MQRTIGFMISLAIIFVGLLLMIFMIYNESEPGLIPLALVVLGMGKLLGDYYLARRLNKKKDQ